VLKHDKFMDKISHNNEKFTRKRKRSQTTPDIIMEVDEGLGIELKHLKEL